MEGLDEGLVTGEFFLLFILIFFPGD
jgi:hypothetical protein